MMLPGQPFVYTTPVAVHIELLPSCGSRDILSGATVVEYVLIPHNKLQFLASVASSAIVGSMS